jgi:DNA-directed RNA polymerase I, II, and III subunit RPABC2
MPPKSSTKSSAVKTTKSAKSTTKKTTTGKQSNTKPTTKPKKPVEKLSDLTDDPDLAGNRNKRELDTDGNPVEIEDEEDLGDEDPAESELPALEAISTALKEKYEYKPLQRVKTVRVNPQDRITSEVLTKFEYAEVISHRAKQIEDGDTPYTDIGDLSDPIDMAKKEIADKKCPLSTVRVRTTEHDVSIAEVWQINEMAVPFD